MSRYIVENNISKPISIDIENYVPISAQTIKEKFGSTSPIYLNIKEKLEFLWNEVKDEPSIKAKIDNWASVIGTLYGYKPDLYLLMDHTYLSILAKIPKL